MSEAAREAAGRYGPLPQQAQAVAWVEWRNPYPASHAGGNSNRKGRSQKNQISDELD